MHGDSMDLPMVKAKISEGLVAKLLTVRIVCIVVVLISESSGAFLQNGQHTREPPAFRHTGLLHRAGLSGLKGFLPALSFSNVFSNLFSKVNL